MKAIRQIAWVVAGSALLAGCVPLVMTGATSAVYTVTDRRSTGNVVGDQVISKRVWLEIDQKLGQKTERHITVTSYNHRVLLSGEVQTAEAKHVAKKTAAISLDVSEVIDELKVGPNASTSQRISDTTLMKKVETNLFMKEGIPSTQIKVIVERGIVYLMGMLSAKENTLACQTAAKTSGVSRVVSYVELLTPQQIQHRMKAFSAEPQTK